MSDYDYDAIVACADALRPQLQGRAVVGVALPPDTAPDALGLSRVDGAAGRPFEGMGLSDTRTVLMMPERVAAIDENRIFAIRVLRALGGETLVIADRCVAVRPRFLPGSPVMIVDHLNLTGSNPLAGPNDERIGPRFPDMAEPYDPRLLTLVERIAVEEGQIVQRCVYAGVSAPPTAAECRFLAYAGADVYGTGVVPDTVTARHAGLRVVAVASVMARQIPEGRIAHETPHAGAVFHEDFVKLLKRLIWSV